MAAFRSRFGSYMKFAKGKHPNAQAALDAGRGKTHKPKICAHCWGYIPAGVRPRTKYCEDCIPLEYRDITRVRKMITNYGIAWPEYQAMYFEQNGQCAIKNCEQEAVYIDHCHTTGKVRALLCVGCNSGLGHVEKPGWAMAALEYLAEYGNH